MPCSVLTVPLPTLMGEQRISSMPSRSSATHAPTMSQMESTAPTSWKWTFSIGTLCDLASASPSLWNTASELRCAFSDKLPARMIFSMCGRWRCFFCSSKSTKNLDAAMPLRLVFSSRNVASSPRLWSAPSRLGPVGAGIEKRADGHIAADTGECVEIADFH